MVVTTGWAVVLLDRTPTYQPWLHTAVLIGGLLAAVGLWAAYHHPRRVLLAAAAGLATASLLAGPAAYAVSTIGQGNAGVNAAAGPSARTGAGFGGARLGAGGFGTGTVDTALIAYLEANRNGAEYLVATFGSQSSAPIIIATGQPVMTIGGFNGSDPAPTLAQFQRLVAEGKVRYVLVSGGPGGGGLAGGPDGGNATTRSISQWVAANGKEVAATTYGATTGFGTLYEVSSAA